MTRLIDYITKEDSDIAFQFKYVSQLDKVLKNLQKTFQELTSNQNNLPKIKESNINQDITTVCDKQPDTCQTDSNKKLVSKNDGNKSEELSEGIKNFIDSEKRKKFEKTIRIQSSSSTSSNEKMEQYRRDLLKQIEDKKESQRKQEELIRNEEKVLENKIIQQRLAMYLEYLEEQKKADFITRPKVVSDNGTNMRKIVQFESSGGDCNTNDFLINGNMPGNKIDNVEVQRAIGTTMEFHQNKDLNEVRKIMQNDHYELLEKLLELDI